jgi:pyrroloquinoline quinone biosynthesis protein B
MAQDAKRRPAGPYVAVLGIAQDGGYPQAGCQGPCCARAWRDPGLRRLVSCLGIVDPVSGERWLIDCTPDFPQQLHQLDCIVPRKQAPAIGGILLTHAHVGHYAGLLYLAREAMGAEGVPVHTMPMMREFLAGNGPWNQLVASGSIELRDLTDGVPLTLNERLSATPFLVPHRGESSETVGFRIQGPARAALYLPDIDSWELWENPIEDVIASADVAYLDGTFFANDELPGRELSEIPHPLIADSIERFSALPAPERRKVRFLHLNHSNPALDPASSAAKRVREALHNAADQGERFAL